MGNVATPSEKMVTAAVMRLKNCIFGVCYNFFRLMVILSKCGKKVKCQ